MCVLKSAARCVAIDLGAGSGRLIEGGLKDGCMQIRELCRFTSPMMDDAPSGYLIWDTEKMVGAIENGLANALAAGAIASVGVDSWGVDYVLLDAQRRQVGKTVCYRDHRTQGIMERVRTELGDENIYRRTGIQFAPYNTLYQLAACVQQEPAWIEQAQHLLMIPDYVHFRLCGKISNEYTNATTTQMLGLDGPWEECLRKGIGLQKDLMQDPLPAGSLLGEMQRCEHTVKVIAPATHDTASAVAGTPFEGVDELFISSGTWSLMGFESMQPFASHTAMQVNVTNEGGIGGRYRVLKNIMGLWPLQCICREHAVTNLAALVAEAAQSQPWRSIVNLNDLCFLSPASMTAALDDYCRQHHQPRPDSIAQFARCIFDSLALLYRKTRQELELLRGRSFSRVRIIGGGSQNHLLNQLCADACDLPVSAGPVEASALGNLSAQLIALGELPDLEAARSVIRSSFPVQEFSPCATIPDDAWQLFEDMLQTN